MSNALIVVDVQNDFVTGSLAVPGAEEILAEVEHYTKRWMAGPVVATKDWHYPKHLSFTEQGGPWPPHCIAGSWGAELAWKCPVGTPLFMKGMYSEAYSGFDGTNLDHSLRERDVESVTIVGLALDYCVRATALDAVDNFYGVTVLRSLTRPVERWSGNRAVAELKAKGVSI